MKGFIIIIAFLGLVITSPVAAVGFWPVTSVDTMKYSRDISREPDVIARIPGFVDAVAKLKPSYIAIATPYDEEFYPVLSTWVREARKHNIKIWFRGNWSSWEGWFGYKKFSDYTEHHTKTAGFIRSHKELFADGDIFTPAPEPENGGLGDPRGSKEKTEKFRQFLITSYNSCVEAIKDIDVDVTCGYFSVNGDIAREILTEEVVHKTGGVVVIDHYVKTPGKLVDDVDTLAKKYNAIIVLGEFGAPIPDIHGTMSESEQSKYVADVLSGLLRLGNKVGGVNYWTAFGGTTKLLENNLTMRPVAHTLAMFYDPPRLTGTIKDQFGEVMSGISVTIMDGAIATSSGSDGRYQILLPGTSAGVRFSGKDIAIQDIGVKVVSPVTQKDIVVFHSNVSFLTRFLSAVRAVVDRLRGVFIQR